MRRFLPLAAAGVLTGLVSGLFGGGGGMILLPLLSRWSGLPDRRLYPTCLSIMFPICALSAAVFLLQESFSPLRALPYLLGGTAGGLAGGRLYSRVPSRWIRRLFGVFLCFAGVRYLL